MPLGAVIARKIAKQLTHITAHGSAHTLTAFESTSADIGNAARLRLLKARLIPMVAELLDVGERSALSSSYLCKILGISRRQLAREVERERRAGAFICANGDGFFIAESVPEFRAYLRTLESRARELDTTRSALIAAAGRMGVAGF